MLDEWPASHIAVMLSIGNALSNSVWESNTKGQAKPGKYLSSAAFLGCQTTFSFAQFPLQLAKKKKTG